METVVRLVVTSDTLNSEDITSRVGVSGTRTWNVGDVRLGTKIKEKENGWLLNSSVEKASELEEHIESIKSLVSGFEDNFKKFASIEGNDVELSVVLYFSDRPPLGLESEDITWLYKIGASVDIDLYPMPSEDDS